MKKDSDRGWFTREYRTRAATLFEAKNFSAAAAGKELGKDTKGRAPTRPAQFCKRQYDKFKLHGTAANRPIPGRSPKVPKKLVQEVVTALAPSEDAEGEPVYMESVGHALQANPSLKRKFAQIDAHPRTVTRAVAAGMAASRLQFSPVKRQARLNEEQKRARKKFCREALERGTKKLQARVFVDESSFDLRPTGKAIAATKKGEPPSPWTDPQQKKRSAISVHWIGAVMHGVGNVGFFLTTGTTWKRPRYKA